MNLDYAEIGKRIAHRRKELKLTQTKVEEQAGLSHKYLSRIEKGASIPSLETLMGICSALSCSPDFVLVGTDLRLRQDDFMRLVDMKTADFNEKERLVLINFIEFIKQNTI